MRRFLRAIIDSLATESTCPWCSSVTAVLLAMPCPFWHAQRNVTVPGTPPPRVPRARQRRSGV